MKKITAITLHAQTELALVDFLKSAPTNRLPAEEELAKALGVSRTTIREAMHSLLRKGYLVKRKGKGNFILNSVVRTQMRVDQFNNFPELIRQAGYAPTLTRTYTHRATPAPEIAAKLGCADHEAVHSYLWQFLADGCPAIQIYLQVPEKLFTKTPPADAAAEEALEKLDFFQAYCGLDMSHIIAFFEPAHIREVNRAFGLGKNEAILRCRQYYYDLRDRCVAYSDIYINPRILTLSIVAPY